TATVGGCEINRVVGISRRSEELDEALGIRSARGGLILEVLGGESEAAVRSPTNQLVHLIDHRGTAVSGKPHDLVLVLVYREPQIRGSGRIQHAHGMRNAEFAEQ